MQVIVRVLQRILFFVAAIFGLIAPPEIFGRIMENGIDPANLGKGDHIYFMSLAVRQLGGNVPGVTNVPSLMAYEKSQGIDFIVVKAASGAKEFPAGRPQFTDELVADAHAAGLKIFGYTRSDGKDVPGEIELAAKIYGMGADGFLLDAEAEWETRKLENNFEKAIQLCSAIKARFPNKFLAHAPMPVIHVHTTFPYKEFGYYCDAVMPQYYWQEGGVGKIAEYSPTVMVAKMDVEWRNWQNSLQGKWTNAIKPLAPIGQAWNTTPTNIVTAAQIIDFVKALKTDPNPVTPGGYNGVSYWRADLHTPEIWSGIAAGDIGKPPCLLQQPPDVTATNAATNIVFTVDAGGAMPRHYQWLRNGRKIAGATNSSFSIPKIRAAHAGTYTAVVMNRLGSVVSRDVLLKVTPP